jgi:hypothetical protein
MTEIQTRKLTEGEVLQRNAQKAKRELERLEGEHRKALHTLEEVSHQLTKARADADKTSYLVERSGQQEAPPLPSFDEMIKSATAMRPDLNRHEILSMVSAVFGATTSAYANHGIRYGDAHDNPPTIDGDEVRDLNEPKQHYELPPTDKNEGLPRFKKAYPEEV